MNRCERPPKTLLGRDPPWAMQSLLSNHNREETFPPSSRGPGSEPRDGGHLTPQPEAWHLSPNCPFCSNGSSHPQGAPARAPGIRPVLATALSTGTSAGPQVHPALPILNPGAANVFGKGPDTDSSGPCGPRVLCCNYLPRPQRRGSHHRPRENKEWPCCSHTELTDQGCSRPLLPLTRKTCLSHHKGLFVFFST